MTDLWLKYIINITLLGSLCSLVGGTNSIINPMMSAVPPRWEVRIALFLNLHQEGLWGV